MISHIQQNKKLSLEM